MADVYQTKNSTYVVDLEGKRYKRLPVNTQGVRSDKLVYSEWLPLKDVQTPVWLEPDPMDVFKAPEERPLVLRILHEESTIGIITTEVVFMASRQDPAEWEA